MKIAKIVAAVLGGVFVLFLGAVMMQPDTLHIERTKVINAAPSDVYPLVADFRTWAKWSPWQELDPNQKTAFSENAVGKGAWTSWEGNADVGKGKMTYTEAVENQKLVEKLEFMEPFAATATVTFTFTPEGENTKVAWIYDGDQGFMSKAFGLFSDMDAMLGKDFEKGLGKLKPMAETAAVARKEAEAKAAAEAAAAALLATDAGGAVTGTPPQ